MKISHTIGLLLSANAAFAQQDFYGVPLIQRFLEPHNFEQEHYYGYGHGDAHPEYAPQAFHE